MVPKSTSDCPWVILKQAKPPTPSLKLLQVLKQAIRSKSGLANQEEINREEMALSTLSRQASRKTVIKPKIEPGERCDQTSEIKPGERCDQTLEIEPGESYDQTGEIHPGKSSATSKSSTPPRAPTPSPTARSTTTPASQIQN